MEDLISLIVFGVFLWSALGGVLGRKKPAPGQRHPGEAQPDPDGEAMRDEPIFAPRPAAPREEDETAADLIPDDLWEILTGERRDPAHRRRQSTEGPPGEPSADAPREPAADVAAESPGWDEIEPVLEEPAHWIGHDPAPRRESTTSVGWDDEASEIGSPVAATAGSREETEPGWMRNASSERRADAPEVVRSVTAPSRERTYRAEERAQHSRRASSSRQRALRRAIVLREVLGPPKALE